MSETVCTDGRVRYKHVNMCVYMFVNVSVVCLMMSFFVCIFCWLSTSNSVKCLQRLECVIREIRWLYWLNYCVIREIRWLYRLNYCVIREIAAVL